MAVEVIAQARAILPDHPNRKAAQYLARAVAHLQRRGAQHVPIWPAAVATITTAAWSSPPTMRARYDAIAVGGRYDDVGKVFGQGPPGFSMDPVPLHGLLAKQPQGGARAPISVDEALAAATADARAGETVVVDLLGKLPSTCRNLNCDRELLFRAIRWQVVALKN